MRPFNFQSDFLAAQTRRAFFGRAAGGFGGLALGCMLRENAMTNQYLSLIHISEPTRPY